MVPLKSSSAENNSGADNLALALADESPLDESREDISRSETASTDTDEALDVFFAGTREDVAW
jgi:hypothetical protein